MYLGIDASRAVTRSSCSTASLRLTVQKVCNMLMFDAFLRVLLQVFFACNTQAYTYQRFYNTRNLILNMYNASFVAYTIWRTASQDMSLSV
jgi:hypothetical protein